GPHIGELFGNGISPICVEQGGSRSAISQTELIAGSPLAPSHVPIQKRIGCIEHRSPAVAAIIMFAAKRNIDKALLWVVYVVIEEAIPHAYISACKWIGRDQTSGMGIGSFEIFDYSGCFKDQLSIVRQDWKLAKRPERGELAGNRFGAVEHSCFEGYVLFIESCYGLLAIRREGMQVEFQRHHGPPISLQINLNRRCCGSPHD